MGGIAFEPWEPEETVGKLWHAYASRFDAPQAHEEAAVDLENIGGRLAVFFRGLGGDHAVQIKGSAPERSAHRLSLRRRLGAAEERLARTSFDGEALRLPLRIDALPSRAANEGLYFWLAAASVHAPAPASQDEDLLRADIRALQAAQQMTRATLAACPGLRRLHTFLMSEIRQSRRRRALPEWEAAVEAAILHLLGGAPPQEDLGRAIAMLARGAERTLADLQAPRGYRPFEPVPLWPDLRPAADRARVERDAQAEAGGATASEHSGQFRAKRRSADRAERKDSLILHKFESILSWAEFLNLNRHVEDDDEDAAKKAAEDQDEINLGQISKKPATRLKLHLDLAPEDADRERVSAKFSYPEWDHRTRSYLPDHCRVLASPAEIRADAGGLLDDPKTQRRIRAVRRQFEALRPKRVVLPRQIDGEELDVEAAIAARVDLIATGESSDRVYRAARARDRDLAVSILLDVSRSTESAVTGRAVIDIEREALVALAWGLAACGDEASIHAFSSLRRDRVFVYGCKRFDEPMSATIEQRIASLKPGFYTRLGAAVRHVSAGLAERSRQRRLLLVVTDGKPNDLDHYEGRHGIEDSRMAIQEARRRGQSVHGVTVDAKGQSYFGRIFGRGGYSLVPHPDKLIAALPDLYRRLVAG